MQQNPTPESPTQVPRTLRIRRDDRIQGNWHEGPEDTIATRRLDARSVWKRGHVGNWSG